MSFESRRIYLVRAAPKAYRKGRHCPCCVQVGVDAKARRTRNGRARLKAAIRAELASDA